MKKFINAFCKKVVFDNGGYLINIDISKEDLNKQPANENGFVKLVLSEKKEIDKYGCTHYLYLNEYKKKEIQV